MVGINSNFELQVSIIFSIGLWNEFIELIPNKSLALSRNTFLFCFELLLYPKFLNNGVTLQAPGQNNFEDYFQDGVDKILQSKCISMVTRARFLGAFFSIKIP